MAGTLSLPPDSQGTAPANLHRPAIFAMSPLIPAPVTDLIKGRISWLSQAFTDVPRAVPPSPLI
jgi:hypothetical protein